MNLGQIILRLREAGVEFTDVVPLSASADGEIELRDGWSIQVGADGVASLCSSRWLRAMWIRSFAVACHSRTTFTARPLMLAAFSFRARSLPLNSSNNTHEKAQHLRCSSPCRSPHVPRLQTPALSSRPASVLLPVGVYAADFPDPTNPNHHKS